MKKKLFCLMLSLCMLFTMITVVPVIAAESGSIVISKLEFRLRESGTVRVTGLTEGEIEDGAFISIVKEGTRMDNTYADVYVSDLPEGNVLEFTAPSEFGKYELRVVYADNKTLYGKVSFSVVPATAKASDIILSKTQARLRDKMKVTINGLTEEEITEGVWIGLVKEGTKIENTYADVYVDSLPDDNTWEFAAPSEFGKYEIRVVYPDNKTLFGKVSFSVIPAVAKEYDIKLSKDQAKIREKLKVTVNGLTEEEITEGVWIGLVKEGTKIENTYADVYVDSLPNDNTWEFEAPAQFGKYEIRVVYPDNKTVYGKISFTVVSSKAKEGNMILSTTSPAPSEKMSFKISGLTEGEIKEGAWMSIVKAGTKLENTYADKYISDLPESNTWEFNAPSEAGTYELRVFCSSSLTPEQMEYAMFGSVSFTVSGKPAVVVVEGYENLSGWAVSEVNSANENGLVTDTVMSAFTKELTREEFCELVVKLYERMTGKNVEPIAVNPFKDTKNPEILKAYNLGIVNGIKADEFGTGSFITREQIATMIVRTLKLVMPEMKISDAQFTQKFHDENDISSWAFESIKFLNANEIIKGSQGYILPKANTTREQGILLIQRTFAKFFTI